VTEQQWQVTGEAVFVKAPTPFGPQGMVLHRHAVLPPGVSAETIEHLKGVNLIAPFGGDPTVAATVEPAVPTEPPAPVDVAVDAETAAKREAARAKLAEGVVPDGRAAQPVLVEYLATKGYDYDALKDTDKTELAEMIRKLG
jgi:hypothetical protein